MAQQLGIDHLVFNFTEDFDTHVVAPYVAAQGTALGRRGRVHITRDDDGTIWVGGRTATLFAGTTQEPVLC